MYGVCLCPRGMEGQEGQSYASLYTCTLRIDVKYRVDAFTKPRFTLLYFIMPSSLALILFWLKNEFKSGVKAA